MKGDYRAVPAGTSEAPSPSESSNEQSGLFRSLIPGRSLSRALWELDFGERLPIALSRDGVQATLGSLDRTREFLSMHYPELTQEGLGRIPSGRMARAKQRYLMRQCDFLELTHGRQTVGVLVGAPDDWSTYYVRTFAVLPRYQRPALLRRFIKEVLFAALIESEVERIVAETSPANSAMSRLLCELRFFATGHRLTDRWGPLVRYTRFFDRACEQGFMNRFAGTAPRGLSLKGKEEPR